MTSPFGLLAILALILGNAYFVAAEFAFVAVRRSHLEERAAEGDPRAARAVRVVQRLSFVLSGAQLGITATSLVLGFIATPIIAELLAPALTLARVPEGARGGLAATVALVLATMLQMVVGELAPKNLAIARPETFASRLAAPTLLYTRLAGWLIRIFDSSANALLRALGIEPVEHLETGVSPEELELIIVESSSGGHLTADQAQLLTRALEFRQLRAADVMVPRPQVSSVPADATGADLRAVAASSGHSRFPVVDADRDEILGVVQAKDLLRHAPGDRDGVPVRTLMSRALAVPESAALSAVVAEMRRARS
ncbi:MAG TPA: hemolysin family protein, partial [Egibacteraceae bacterium]|nr:hemolysin family protein [Egibacteraceae bacterium]